MPVLRWMGADDGHGGDDHPADDGLAADLSPCHAWLVSRALAVHSISPRTGVVGGQGAERAAAEGSDLNALQRGDAEKSGRSAEI
jgi:hypothetical protein